MSLFPADPKLNLLPKDGIVNYFGPILKWEEANLYFDRIFQESSWALDEAMLFGKHIVTKRKVAWYGDREYDYHYSGTIKRAIPWSDPLLEIKKIVESLTQISFNSCLLNLYHNGMEGMAWHSDDEKSLGLNTIIASLSLGAERRFCLRHKSTKETVTINLEPGSLLIMQGETQSHWQHCLPKSLKVIEPRINLTFRRFIDL